MAAPVSSWPKGGAVVADVTGGRDHRIAARGERLEVVDLRTEGAGVVGGAGAEVVRRRGGKAVIVSACGPSALAG